ncbi:MAG: DUF4232 domain-containing protein [Streptosporangiaceae bacterium]
MGMIRISLIAVLGAISVASCSSTTDQDPAVTTAPTSAPISASVPPSVAATPSAASESPAIAPSPTTEPAGGVGPCTNAALVIAADNDSGAAGTIVARFIVTNKGPKACTMGGHPAIYPYAGGDFQRIPGFRIGHVPADFGNFGGTPGPTTLAATSGTAAFFVKYGTAPVGDAKCTKVTGLLFAAPPGKNWDDAPAVPFPFTSCGGSVQVSSIFPPTQGF